MNNSHNVEKTMQKFQQLAKDAQSSGDPVLIENYLQHADHYLRRFNELSEKIKETSVDKSEQSLSSEEKKEGGARRGPRRGPLPPPAPEPALLETVCERSVQVIPAKRIGKSVFGGEKGGGID